LKVLVHALIGSLQRHARGGSEPTGLPDLGRSSIVSAGPLGRGDLCQSRVVTLGPCAAFYRPPTLQQFRQG
jgi:hypothetical protein